MNKQPVAKENLQNVLKQIYDNRTDDKVLYLKADRGLKYIQILDAMEIASKAGVKVVGAITDQTIGTTSTIPGDVMSTEPAKAPGKKQ
jgi:biopolymer transport protein ExbD